MGPVSKIPGRISGRGGICPLRTQKSRSIGLSCLTSAVKPFGFPETNRIHQPLVFLEAYEVTTRCLIEFINNLTTETPQDDYHWAYVGERIRIEPTHGKAKFAHPVS